MLSRVSTRSFSTSIPKAIKISTKPSDSLVSTLKVVVNNAGSKSPVVGLPHLLSASTFLNTETKSGLRLKREAELLGGEYTSTVTRDAIVLEAKFLKEALPYFVNALGSTLTEAQYKTYQIAEVALPFAKYTYESASSSPSFKASEELHAISFRKGLGNPLYFDGSKPYSSEDVASFAKSVFTSENIEIIAEGVVEEDLTKFVAESPLASLPSGSTKSTPAKLYTGAQSRIRAAGPTVGAIGIPVASSDAATYALVAAYLKASVPSTISTKVESKLLSYADASLLSFTVESSNASEVASALSSAVSSLKNASSLSKYSKLAALDTAGSIDLSSAASSIKAPAFNLVVVGDVDAVPYAEEL